MKIYNVHSPFYIEETNFSFYNNYKNEIISKLPIFSGNEINEKINFILSEINHKKFTNLLIYGQVQSGKTTFFTSLIFSLIDKYKNPSIVILCDNNSKLMEQTYNRVERDIKQIYSSKKVELYQYNDFKNFVTEEKSAADKPKIYFCLKQKDHLQNMNSILEATDWIKNLIIIDDESDVATVSSNDGEINKNIETMINVTLKKDCVVNYFAITATPFDNCAVNFETILKPESIISIDTDSSYFGLKKFSSMLNDYSNNNIIKINKNDYHSTLNECINAFMSDVYKSLDDDHATMLINNEVRNIEQNNLCDQIKNKINNDSIVVSPLNATIESKLLNDDITLDDDNLTNSQIIVGCNKVSRGVTFKKLDYVFLRGNEKISMSTLLQRARWFGYRKNQKDIKVYLPECYQNYFIKIADLVLLQFNIINNKKILSPKTFNKIIENIMMYDDLIYSNFKASKQININEKIMWYDDQWNKYNNLDFYKLYKIFMNLKSDIVNNNLVFKFKNIDELKNSVEPSEFKLLKDLVNKTTSYVFKECDKPLVFRFIEWNGNHEQKTNYRKIMDINGKNYISIHNYSDEYNNNYFNSIVIDFVKFGSWMYKGNKKEINNNYNYKIIVKDLSSIN